MVDAAIERQLVACLNELPLVQQREVLAFARRLREQPMATPGSELLRFAGAIETADLSQMSAAIEQGCERIDADEW